jgi:branched-chain amino acid transport system ATP-binding protein
VQKRVIIARALMARPSLLLLDEPASGLSATDVGQLVDLLGTLRQRMAVALVEHNVDMVLAVSDTITVLNLGRVLASGTPDEIRANADVATAYLGQQVAHA